MDPELGPLVASATILAATRRAAGDDGCAKYDRVLASTTTSARPLGRDDPRLSVPLFTLRESATYLHTPLSTLHAWAHPKDGEPLVTVFPRAGRRATVPFVGFAEAFVLGALRSAGVPMQRIRPFVDALEKLGTAPALATLRALGAVGAPSARRTTPDALVRRGTGSRPVVWPSRPGLTVSARRGRPPRL